jgi:hypothetical protein
VWFELATDPDEHVPAAYLSKQPPVVSGRTMPTRHERSDDGMNWRPSMNVTLRKVVELRVEHPDAVE